MARSYTVSTSVKWDDASFGGATARQGADTYTINSGATLTIDTDTRTCSNSDETVGNLGNVTLTRGNFTVDGTTVRILAFDAGNTGVTVPAKGATLYDDTGAAYGECLGVWATLASAPKVHGTDMWPSTGFIKFRSVIGSFADNAQVRTATGGGGTQVATANGIDRVGWLEIIGIETGTFTFTGSTTTGLSTFTANGEWFDAGQVPSGGWTPSTDSIQLPASYSNTHYGGVEVETGNGTGVYEWWPNAAGIAATQYATDARGKVCWITSQGLLRFGYDGSVSGGMSPAASARIRVGNLLFLNCASTTPWANVAPNTTLGTRYEFSGNGRWVVDKANFAWRFNVTGVQANVSNTTSLDSVAFSTIIDLSIDGLVVGCTGSAVESAVPFTIQAQPFPHTANNVVALRRQIVTTGALYFNSAEYGTYNNFKAISNENPSATSSSAYQFYTDSCRYCTINGLTVVGGRILVNGLGLEFNDTVYSATISGTVPVSYPDTAFVAGNYSVINGLSWLIDPAVTANVCHPYGSLVQANRVLDVWIKNIGTQGSPLNVGSTNVTGAVLAVISSQSLDKVRMNRIYTTDLRSGVITFAGALSGGGVLWQVSDVRGGGSTDGVLIPGASYARGCFGDASASPTALVPGRHIVDAFSSSTAGKIVVYPADNVTVGPMANAVTFTGGVVSTGSSYYMPDVDDAFLLKVPYRIRGYTAFNGAPTTSAGPTLNNFLIEISIDEGANWVVARSVTGTTDITSTNPLLPDPAVGFTLWVRVTTKTANTNHDTNGMLALSFAMTTTSAAQANVYPLEEIMLTDSRSDGVTDASVLWVAPDGSTRIGFYNGTGEVVTYNNDDGAEKTGSYISRRAGYGEFVGGWTETTSWFNEVKVYFIAQTLIEATIADSGGITFVGDTSATLGASKTLQQLYSNAQHWSCLEANMLYAIPVVSAGGGAYSANVDVVTTGYTLNGSGSLAMGSNTLTASIPWAYTYTGGTFSQVATIPSFAGGTLNIGAAGTYEFTQASSMTVSATPTSASNYVLSDSTFTGTLNFRNTTAYNITVEIPAGVSANSTGSPGAGTVTFVPPQIYQSVTITNLVAGSRVQIYDTTSSTELFNDIVAGTSKTWTDAVAASASRAIRIRVAHVSGTTAYDFLEANIGTCGTTSADAAVSYLANQTLDTTYNSNAVDGSAVTGITIVEGATDRVQIAIAGGSVSWAQIYAYQCYWLFDSVGITDDGAFIEAPDTANYILTGFKIKNTHASIPLLITGGYGVDSTGSVSALYDTTGTSIFPAPAHVVPYATGSGVTPSDVTDIAAASATAAATAVWGDSKALTVPKFLGLK